MNPPGEGLAAGSNLTRPTEDLLTKIVEIGKSNKNLVNSEGI